MKQLQNQQDLDRNDDLENLNIGVHKDESQSHGTSINHALLEEQ
jgi:hypothetical protein